MSLLWDWYCSAVGLWCLHPHRGGIHHFRKCMCSSRRRQVFPRPFDPTKGNWVRCPHAHHLDNRCKSVHSYVCTRGSLSLINSSPWNYRGSDTQNSPHKPESSRVRRASHLRKELTPPAYSQMRFLVFSTSLRTGKHSRINRYTPYSSRSWQRVVLMASPTLTSSQSNLSGHPQNSLRAFLIPLKLLLELMALCQMVFRWGRCFRILLRPQEIAPRSVRPQSSSLSNIFGLTRNFSRCPVVRIVGDFTFLSLVCLLMWIENTRAAAPKWPVRSVENLPTFTRRTLSNRVLVIGNTVSLLLISRFSVRSDHDHRLTRSLHWRTRSISPSFLEAATRRWSSIRQLDIPHSRSTRIARMISCWTFYWTLRWGYFSFLPWGWRCASDGKMFFYQLPPQQHTKCAPNSNDFFPDTPTDARWLFIHLCRYNSWPSQFIFYFVLLARARNWCLLSWFRDSLREDFLYPFTQCDVWDYTSIMIIWCVEPIDGNCPEGITTTWHLKWTN